MVRDPKRALLDYLKRCDRATVAELANELGVTTVAIRQHLDSLAVTGLVIRTSAQLPGDQGRGRPPATWALAAKADQGYANRHSDLTVDLLRSIREAVGEDGLQAVLAKRAERQKAVYAEAIGETPVAIRASSLAKIRSDEGYMAEVLPTNTDDLLLVEHHCPICAAATECQGLCDEELETFQSLFVGAAVVTRETHLLGGDRRCTYRISPTP